MNSIPSLGRGFRSYGGFGVAVIGAALLGTQSSAQIFITVGDWVVPAGASAMIDLTVRNDGEPLQLLGINLNLQIADGGPDAGGVITAPPITDIDLFVPDALFASNNNGRGGNGPIVAQIFEVGTLTRSGTTLTLDSGTSLLASVQFDISQFPSGTWTVSLDTLNGSTVLLNPQGLAVSATLEPGSLTIIPEPTESALAIALLVLAGCGWHRFVRKTS